jgi:dihydrofolate reductase/thymidylate synthase
MKPLSIIVAFDNKYGIARQGQIPWNIPSDLQFFQDTTKCVHGPSRKINAVIFGKRTWKSLPVNQRGLEHRVNIVVSKSLSQEELKKDNVKGQPYHRFDSLQMAVEFCNSSKDIAEIFICGGVELYREAMLKCQVTRYYLTQIKKDYECDLFFPLAKIPNFFASQDWKVVSWQDLDVTDLTSNETVKIDFRKYVSLSFPNNALVQTDEDQYLSLLYEVLTRGSFHKTRNANTWSIFGKTLDFDLKKGFPLLTTKKVNLEGIFEELIFFLRGDTNSNHLKTQIWKSNTTREFLDSVGEKQKELPEGFLGSMYGYQLRFFNAPYHPNHPIVTTDKYEKSGFDQIEYVLNLLKTDPFSRRILMTTFNPLQASEGCLFPCHGISVIFHVTETPEGLYALSCQQTQRSADLFLGVVWNIASYSLLVHLICHVLNSDKNYKGPRFCPDRVILALGDVHIYETHKAQAIRQFLREPFIFPKLSIKRPVTNLVDFKLEDIELTGYTNHPPLPVKMVA